MTTLAIIAKPAGEERDRAIDAWCQSVWSALSMNRNLVVGLLRANGIL